MYSKVPIDVGEKNNSLVVCAWLFAFPDLLKQTFLPDDFDQVFLSNIKMLLVAIDRRRKVDHVFHNCAF
jgi:hypothetical protein